LGVVKHDFPLILLLIVTPMLMSDIRAQKTSVSEGGMTDLSLIAQADTLFNRNQYDKSREIYLKAADEAEASGDNSALSEAYAMIARTYLITEKKEEGRPWLEKASQFADPDIPLAWSRYIGVRGRFEWQDKELEKATATFKEMYDYCSKNGLHERAIDAAHMVAITGGRDDQVEWGLKGIREAEAGNITAWLGPLWNNLGWTYEDMGKYRESLDAYLKARDYHHKYGNEKNKLCADWAVGHAYRLLDQPDSAVRWVNPDLLAKFESIKDIEFQGWTLKEMGEIALLRSMPNSALSYLTQAEEKLQAAGMPEWDPDGYKKLQGQIKNLK
jgi:tetratricopeptide (TPR) repeat protein